MPPTDPLAIRPMAPGEMGLAVEWAAREGWNPGLRDAGCFYRTDPGGFFLALLDGKPAGCVSAVAYGERFGFIGFYIVIPELRGHRVGIALGEKAVARLGERCIGIDGVEKKVKNYARRGFVLAYRNIRYEGMTAGGEDAPGLVPVAELPPALLAEYDRRCFPAPRPRFLELWMTQPGACALAALRGGALAGYGVIRECRKGWKIGPLFADDEGIAERILLALSGKARPGEPFYLDVPEPNRAAVSMAGRFRMTPVFGTARMYRGRAPDVPLHRVFGVTSFELG